MNPSVLHHAARAEWCAVVAAACMVGTPAVVFAQEEIAPRPTATTEPDSNPYEGRLIREIRFQGLSRVTEQYLRNQLRSSPGQPLSWATVREDLRRMERLGEFRDIQADVLVDADLNVIVLFRVIEAPIVKDVLVVGNRQVNDQDIQNTVGSAISLVKGIPIDDYQIGRAQRGIEELYRNKGYYLAKVTVDESELATEGNIIFRVREGERVKVTSIRFEGNDAFTPRELRTDLKTKEAALFRKGAIDESILDGDVAAIVKYYLDRGYMDARASSQVQPSPNGREAIVTFLIEEGRQYTLRSVSVEPFTRRGSTDAPPPEILSPDQIRGLIELKPGDAFSAAAVTRSVRQTLEALQKMGYVDARVDSVQLRVPDTTLVDLTLLVSEGERYKAGMVYIQGNELTQQKVIRREVDIQPDRWLDVTAAKETELRLQESQLFDVRGVKVTVQPEDPKEPGYRDVLVEVAETNTGSLGFGAAVSSDAGVTGVINLNQRNFDVADVPESFEELIKGRAFRGAGQTFNIAIQPGTETQNYTISLLEPYLFETPNSLLSSLYYRTREYDDYDEDRAGTRLRLGRRFGTRWTGSLALRAESITIDDIDSNAPQDVFDVEGDNIITGISADLTRRTVDSRLRPTKGTYTELAVEQVGALGGDFTFTKLSAEHQVFIPIDADYLDNKTVLSFKGRVGYIPQENEAPIFERWYLGGRSFRGFDFRGIGPLGLRTDGTEGNDHVGGDWMIFLGTEIERPVWREVVSLVTFIDSGTVSNDVGFEDYRVAVGAGIRLYIPQFGNAPLAFDFAIPISSESGDDERVFSFSIDLPFQ